jgi:hypothetical protein
MEEETQVSESPVQHAVKNGAILGAVVMVLTILSYMVSIPFMGTFKFILLIFTLYIGFVIYFGIDYRNSIGGYIAFGKAFLHGFIMLAVAGAVGVLFGLLLYNVIDTELGQKLTDAIVTNTEESMRNFGAPEGRIESQLAQMREDMPKNFTPLGQIKGYLIGLIWNAVIVLITSLIVRKSEPVAM